MKDPRTERLIDEVAKRIKEESNKPFIISVMGQTGVGKSSLINALFNTQLKTDPVRPCTKEAERVVVRSETGHELWFHDLPGLGESEGADIKYLTEYRQMLLQSDIVLWAFHSDNRSVRFDLDALNRIIGTNKQYQAELMSKIVFILTKVDVLTPPPWIFAKISDFGVFAPGKTTESLLEQKESYYQEVFIRSYGDLIISQTFNDGSFDIHEPPLSCDEYAVYYKGFLDKERVASLKKNFPHHAKVFDRLYDNYRVIPCSSLFRFNLTLLMLVIINKLGPSAIARFTNFTSNDALSRVSLSQMKKYCNIVVFDQVGNRVVFDLTQEKFSRR